MKDIKVLTIIVTYNGKKWINECIASIIDSSIKSDIFIVDNGSTDGTIEYIQSSFPEVNLIKSKENLGFGKANNIGLQYAIDKNYDYVYLLNQDAWVEKDTMKRLIEISQQNPQYGILSPLQVNKEKNKLDLNFAKNCPLTILSDLLCNCNTKDIYDTDFVMAAHWLIPKIYLELIGGFSPAFPHYGEDDNFVQRVKSRFLKIGIVPSAIGIHDRENRITDKKRKIYLTYISNLKILNNPLIKRRIRKVILNYISILIKTPSEFKIKYICKILHDIYKSKGYLNRYQEINPFLSKNK